MKRGLSYAETLAYVGVKRRTFDKVWRPLLSPMRQGTTVVYDREDVDHLFDEMKRRAEAPASNTAQNGAQNGGGNERPTHDKGVKSWADKLAVSTAKQAETGVLTRCTEAPDYFSVSAAIRKQSVG